MFSVVEINHNILVEEGENNKELLMILVHFGVKIPKPKSEFPKQIKI